MFKFLVHAIVYPWTVQIMAFRVNIMETFLAIQQRSEDE